MKKLLILLSFLALTIFANAQDEVPVIRKVAYPTGYTSQLNLVYTTAPQWEGKMDLYLPPNEKDLSPAIINIHGGGWQNGSKDTQGGFSPYFKAGFAVANIAYRLSGAATAPAAIEDTR